MGGINNVDERKCSSKLDLAATPPLHRLDFLHRSVDGVHSSLYNQIWRIGQ